VSYILKISFNKSATRVFFVYMTKKEKVLYIQDSLEKIYPKTPIPLNHDSIFTLLVAVVLSAQCTDTRVNTITPKLFKRANTAKLMSKMSTEEIAEIIRPCGLTPMKSKGLKGLSEIICNDHQGKVPNSFEALEALPSVGHKTASVVMSQGFGHPAFPVDTHIHRLMTRWGLTSGKNVKQTEKDAKRLFPIENWNKLHLQIIFYGRSHSPARGWKPEMDFITSRVNPIAFKK
jgi:endonuclease-3|tara:strand:- start:1165 stop:1860 length:696 start_codon:yes stop_codon:yes gene_type:complete